MADMDALIDLMRGGNEATVLVNVKFFRGSRDIITTEEFRREMHSALMQKKMRTASVSKSAPKSRLEPINVRDFVTAL